ncbi:hypothetical protein KKA39_00140, partial [Patescibacteria group bacterium]|nr:hypothetical protein [Patescibacteria group bacterium]
NNKKNKGLAPYGAESSRSGFVILFAVMLSSIVLALALGVSNIALKEINFSTSAKDANDAFFAADTGAECALYYDRSDNNAFIEDSPISVLNCAGSNINLIGAISPENAFWSFHISGLGSTGRSCARVNVSKDYTTTPTTTTIISKGYSSDDLNSDDTFCTPGPKAVERELEVTY